MVVGGGCGATQLMELVRVWAGMEARLGMVRMRGDRQGVGPSAVRAEGLVLGRASSGVVVGCVRKGQVDQSWEVAGELAAPKSQRSVWGWEELRLVLAISGCLPRSLAQTRNGPRLGCMRGGGGAGGDGGVAEGAASEVGSGAWQRWQPRVQRCYRPRFLQAQICNGLCLGCMQGAGAAGGAGGVAEGAASGVQS